MVGGFLWKIAAFNVLWKRLLTPSPFLLPLKTPFDQANTGSDSAESDLPEKLFFSGGGTGRSWFSLFSVLLEDCRP